MNEDKKRFPARKKQGCFYCKDVNAAVVIDYKDVEALRAYITEKGKILSPRLTGLCAKHQRGVASAIKRSRHAGLMPFAADV